MQKLFAFCYLIFHCHVQAESHSIPTSYLTFNHQSEPSQYEVEETPEHRYFDGHPGYLQNAVNHYYSTSYDASSYHDVTHHYNAHPKYHFKYGVQDYQTGDIKSQEEERHGDTVKGHYMLHEPDGTIRLVHYIADKNGFRATIQWIGRSKHYSHYTHKHGPY